MSPLRNWDPAWGPPRTADEAAFIAIARDRAAAIRRFNAPEDARMRLEVAKKRARIRSEAGAQEVLASVGAPPAPGPLPPKAHDPADPECSCERCDP